MITLLLFYSLSSTNCIAPKTGIYDVTYKKIDGTCPNFGTYQHYVSFPSDGSCTVSLSISKKKSIYNAVFNGELSWSNDGKIINGLGNILVKSMFGGQCSGNYSLSFVYKSEK